MSISSALNNAISGLTTNARMAEITSSNLSNALTEGYARREVELASSSLGGVGGGVRVAGIVRVTDPILIADRRNADAAFGGSKMQSDALRRIETIIGAVGSDDGLAARLARAEQALIDAAADPASPQRLATAVARFGDVATTFNRASADIQSQRQIADKAISDGVTELNQALRQVEALNADITRAVLRGIDAAGLMDARQGVIDRIATLVPVRQQPRPDGAVALYSAQGSTLIDGKAVQFGFEATPTIIADMTLASGGVSAITYDGAPLDNGFGRLGGGTLEAAFDLRDRTLTQAQADLDLAAADLVARFSDPAVDPTLAPGDAGLLTDGGGAYDPLDIVGLSRRLSLNAAVDPAQGGLTTRLRDGINAAVTGPVGNAAQINRLRDALQTAVSPVAGTPAATAFSRLNGLSESWGAARLRADEGLSFGAARRDMMLQAERALGVDSDVEMQRLIQIEQAYAANAKLIQTVDAMIQKLMEI